MPPPGYHKGTRDVCTKYDVLYISDEVVTGFGRLGHLFASEDVFDIVPDVLISAKGISSGYQPLSATIISEGIYDVISQPGEHFFHGFTYSATFSTHIMKHLPRGSPTWTSSSARTSAVTSARSDPISRSA